MRKYLLFLFVSLCTAGAVLAQGTVTGKLLDAQTKEPLIGASIAVKGTSNGVSASLDGSFKIKAASGSTLVFSYIGYVSKEVVLSGQSVGDVYLDPVSSTMKEVTIIGDVAIDRKTPIAVSTISAITIEEKGAGQEFPELLKSTPGVMATKTGGGYGDSRISVRGFSSNNVALLINGMPANDPESGKIYWSDYGGIKDVTTFFQMQRGLGASKVALPSLGGTLNIITKSLDVKEEGSIAQTVGNNGMSKTSMYLSSGLSDKGWATSFMLTRNAGGMYADGLNYLGYGYFFNLSKVINKTQTLSFTVMGETQHHGQRYTYNSIQTYRSAPQGIKYNSDWGYLDGQFLSAEVNYYSKPIAMLNYNWNINDDSQFASTVYGSVGTGGATFITGTQSGLMPGGSAPRTGNVYSPIDFNAITKTNLANTDGTASTYLQTAANDHQWYGDMSTYKRKLSDNLNLLAGIDLRYYEGNHYYKVNNLLGGNYIIKSDDKNNPNAHLVVGDKFNSNYRYDIISEGAFLQTEYTKDNLTAFVSVAGSNTGNKRIDYFSYLNSDPARTSKYVNFLGYQAKGGANYNLDNHNNVFANIGYLQRPPLVASIFLNKKNDINANAVAEKLFSYELGYGYRSAAFSANVNLYRSTYKDKSVTPKSTINQDGSITTANLTGVNELHQGVEIDFRYKPISEVTLSGMLSVGDYHYLTDAGPIQVTSDVAGSPVVNIPKVYLKGLKVGDVAQTTAALGLDVQALPKLKLGANANYYANYTSYYNFQNITTAGLKPWKVPSYTLLDVNAVYRFKFAGLDASLIANVYNLFNTTYLSDSYDSNLGLNATGGTAGGVGVFYGFGRTYTTGVKIKF